jgi:hypothetical protein
MLFRIRSSRALAYPTTSLIDNGAEPVFSFEIRCTSIIDFRERDMFEKAKKDAAAAMPPIPH